MTPDGSRRPYIAGNWKMFNTAAEARAYVEDLRGRIEGLSGVDVGLCAPFTSLAATLEAAQGTDIRVCAQNMHYENEGPYTGEISAPMLNEIGVQGVVLGHSERRQYFNETDRALQEKVPAALAAGLEPILCVGESEDEREQGETERRLRHQVQEGLEKVAEADLPRVVIAYEPIWAIGTGKVATTEQAQEAIAFIRALVGDRSSEAAAQVRIQYGGSVKPDNAAELLAQPDIDGALVGGASLDPEGFAEILSAAAG
jgi:triosephosphate isomerase (TIM)